MPDLTIPPGQSLREVAERLGMDVQELQKHCGIRNADEISDTDRVVALPPGIFKERDRERRSQYAAVPDLTREDGLNPTVALGLEAFQQQRSHARRQHRRQEDRLPTPPAIAPGGSDEDLLAQAKNAYLRYEAESNQFAIDLLTKIIATEDDETRAEAFAYTGCAHARRVQLFGEQHPNIHLHAISAAKSALAAAPKLSMAHLARGLAFAIKLDANDAEKAKGRAAFEQAIRIHPEGAWAWTELGRVVFQQGDFDSAAAAVRRALDLDAEDVLAWELLGRIALARDDDATLEEAMRRSREVSATYANSRLLKVEQLIKAGDLPAAYDALNDATELAFTEEHLQYLERRFEAAEQSIWTTM